MSGFIKFITDFVPLLAFFISYKVYGMITATCVLLATSLVALIVYYIYHKKLPVVLILSTAIITIFGFLTIFTGDPKFVKMKPTIISFIFSTILFYGAYRNTGYMKHLFNSAIALSEKNWIVLSRRFGLLFLCIGVANEIIWRNMPENFWVNFKVFGILVISIIFLISQLSFIHKNQLK